MNPFPLPARLGVRSYSVDNLTVNTLLLAVVDCCWSYKSWGFACSVEYQEQVLVRERQRQTAKAEHLNAALVRRNYN